MAGRGKVSCPRSCAGQLQGQVWVTTWSSPLVTYPVHFAREEQPKHYASLHQNVLLCNEQQVKVLECTLEKSGKPQCRGKQEGGGGESHSKQKDHHSKVTEMEFSPGSEGTIARDETG